MDEIEAPDPAYVKGFNQGYLLAEHMPELVNIFSKTEGNSPQLEGVKHGIEQFQFELTKEKEEKLPDWMRRDRFSELEKDNTIEIDKDKDDLEKD